MSHRGRETAAPSWKPAAAALLTGGATALAAVGLHARYRAPYLPRLETIAIPLPPAPSRRSGYPLGATWPPASRPLRIGFVTDTHVGPMIGAADIDRALELLFREEPDLLCLGGDFVCESPRFIPEAAAVFGCYAGSARLGAFAVLGNHDIATDAPRLTREFARHGIRVLRNEAVAVGEDSRRLWIAGIDDALLGKPDLDQAFGEIPPGAATLSLWHEPDWAERVARRGAFLQLSGHSHGGQIRLPVVGPISTPQGGKRFPRGLNCAAGMPVYTSRGLGTYRPPVRFRCSPEVTLVTLTE